MKKLWPFCWWHDSLCEIIFKSATTKSFLKLTSNYGTVVEYEVNTKKSNAFLYVSNEQVEFEIKNIFPAVRAGSSL